MPAWGECREAQKVGICLHGESIGRIRRLVYACMGRV